MTHSQSGIKKPLVESRWDQPKTSNIVDFLQQTEHAYVMFFLAEAID